MRVHFRRLASTLLLPVFLSACSLLSHQSLEVAILPSPDNRTLISFDVYADAGTIHSLSATASNEGKSHITYRYSNDGGRSWHGEIELSDLLGGKLESKLGNDLQIAAHGDNVLAVWQVEGELPGMGPLQVVASADGGKNWKIGNNPTGSDTDQSHADLAVDGEGRWHLVWLDDRDENGYQGLRYARSGDQGQNWQAQTIDDSSCSCCWNRLTISANGRLNVLYRDMEPRDMALAQSIDAGDRWQRISSVGDFNWQFDGCPHNGGALATSDSQHLHGLVWTGAEQKAGLYHLQSTDGGNSWTPPQAMQSAQPGFHGDLAITEDGRLLAIWDSLGSRSQLYFSLSGDQGQHWSDAQQLATGTNPESMPRLIATDAGWLAMWVEQQPGAGKRWRSALIQ